MNYTFLNKSRSIIKLSFIILLNDIRKIFCLNVLKIGLLNFLNFNILIGAIILNLSLFWTNQFKKISYIAKIKLKC
ncbi:hypothetical protein BpHYR1_033983 [Brachionus plicatilis]|uniref:Uncharacterized protein n=1 Tax=Brachionus plicatilis TaxID=10195 RepID=A0A3M7R433_BRAPC|nr:hypothetical protein BpHYR1_033983 [Brachionus plicatilis]